MAPKAIENGGEGVLLSALTHYNTIWIYESNVIVQGQAFPAPALNYHG